MLARLIDGPKHDTYLDIIDRIQSLYVGFFRHARTAGSAGRTTPIVARYDLVGGGRQGFAEYRFAGVESDHPLIPLFDAVPAGVAPASPADPTREGR